MIRFHRFYVSTVAVKIDNGRLRRFRSGLKEPTVQPLSVSGDKPNIFRVCGSAAMSGCIILTTTRR